MTDRDPFNAGMLAASSLILLTAIASAGAADAPRLPYDPHAWETTSLVPGLSVPWTNDDLEKVVVGRAEAEKSRREMHVDYYRIGHTLAFPLPVDKRPLRRELPPGIDTIVYPWCIWLSWKLEERWRVLHCAWRDFGDGTAGTLLQKELAALDDWDRFCEVNGQTGLVTAHLAASLDLALGSAAGWNGVALARARRAADSLIERDVWPWFGKTWKAGELNPARLGNIPVIVLMRAARLARTIASPRADALDARAREVLRAWCAFRTGAENHTEGTAYDGYLLDSLTEWLAAQPDRAALLDECRGAFRNQATHWIQLTVPGRPDLHVALGDCEPEMTHWASALVLLVHWYRFEDAAWLLRRMPPARMRAAALTAAYKHNLAAARAATPDAGIHELPNAIAMRTGWTHHDLLAAISISRGPMGHLQADTGQLVLAWGGRTWIADPGYQQYRPGPERDFTLGLHAHNAPVIDGTTQTLRAGRLARCEATADGWLHAQLDLAPCYAKLPVNASVLRDVWVIDDDARIVVVRDTLTALTGATTVTTSWHGATHMAWSFRDGWARLGNEEDVIWMGCVPGSFEPASLARHPGSRGPLTHTGTRRLDDGNAIQWWIFCCDTEGKWDPPRAAVDGKALRLGVGRAAWVVR